MQASKLMELTKVSLCVALLCVSAFIVIPIPFTPVLITAQTMIVNLVALVLRPAQSAAAMGIYLLLGICGLPVFSGGTAGLGHLLGPTGGFFIGFLVATPLISWIKGKNNRMRRCLLATIAVGVPVIGLFAAGYFCLSQHTTFGAALMATVVPFLIGDVVKCVAAALVAVPLNKALSHQRAAA